jgi:hypothetical protein
MIEAGASMALRHVNRLPLRPSFETLAHDELQKLRSALEGALAKVKAAEELYLSKPLEKSDVCF